MRVFLLLLLWLMSSSAAYALPMYGQRSGRNCANCHVSPTLESEEGWDNPELAKRKCTLSCSSCHVDPTGGGLRNSSGRYFGQSTLPIIPTQDRPYSDVDREMLSDAAIWKMRHKLGGEPVVGENGRSIPTDWEEVQAGVGEGQNGRAPQLGHQPGGPIELSFWDGRYGDLNADPVLNFGVDLRAAYWTGSETLFPMQTDLHAAFHPIHHLTLMTTLAGRSQTSGFVGSSPVFTRRAFVMLHELPGFSWAKAGVFQPSFGTFIDDHTAPIRDLFEMDLAGSEDTVTGVELGATPNYPFGTVSVFANDSSALTGGTPDSGWGAAVNAGWRDLGWSLSAHGQIRRRNQLGRGDFEAAGIAWGFNPAYYIHRLPVTLMGEVSAGQRALEGQRTQLVATFTELSWIIRNGVVLRYRADVFDQDLSVQPGWQQRHGVGLSVVPVPGVTLDALARHHVDGLDPPHQDALMQLHLWF